MPGDLLRDMFSAMRAFNGLGKALRWLRARKDDRKQYQVAEAAGITKAMLSAYETGKQKPSLETLEKILEGLDADLGDLHRALRTVRGQKEGTLLASQIGSAGDGETDVYQLLGFRGTLPIEAEESLHQMLLGFHSYLRHLSRMEAELRHRLGQTSADGSETSGGEEGPED